MRVREQYPIVKGRNAGRWSVWSDRLVNLAGRRHHLTRPLLLFSLAVLFAVSGPLFATNSPVAIGMAKAGPGTNSPVADSPITAQRKRADSLRDPAEAVRAYERLERLAAASEPETVAYALFQQAAWRQRERRTSEAVTLWQRLRRFHPQSPYAATSLALEAGVAPTPTQREKLREELLAKYPNSPETATVLCERGQVAFDRQDYAAAVKWWGELVTRFPRHAKVVPVSKSLEIARLAATGKQEEADGLALLARADKLYDNAEVSLEDRAMAAYMMGHYYIVRNQDEAARMMYRWVWENAPESPWAAEAGLATAQLWLRRDEPSKAELALEWAAGKFAHTAAHKWILFTIGNRHLCYHADRQKAWHFYERLLDEYPEDKLAETTRKHWAEIKKLPDAELRRQAQALRDKEREAKTAHDHLNRGER